MNKEQVLNTTNFQNFTSSQIVDMLRMMQLEIKNMRHNRDYELEQLRHQITILEAKTLIQDTELQKLQDMNRLYLQLLEQPLTFKERLTGKKHI